MTSVSTSVVTLGCLMMRAKFNIGYPLTTHLIEGKDISFRQVRGRQKGRVMHELFEEAVYLFRRPEHEAEKLRAAVYCNDVHEVVASHEKLAMRHQMKAYAVVIERRYGES